MIDEHGINRKYTQHFSFPQDKWERIFGLREELKTQEEIKAPGSIYGYPVAVSGSMEGTPRMIFGPFDDLGKPRETKLIKVEND